MAYEKLRAAPCFKDVHDRLEAGSKPERVAEWAQTDAKCLTDIKLDSLTRTLYRYKKELVPTAAAVVASTGADGKVSLGIWERLKGVERGINEVDELEKLYLLQLGRIHQGRTVEETINFLDKNVRREVELAANILEKSTDLKLRLGIYTEAPKQVNVNASGAFGGSVVESVPQDKREQLAEAARVVLARLSAGPTATATVIPASAAPIAEAEFEVVTPE